jgi:histidine triad (HIT) family protein
MQRLPKRDKRIAGCFDNIKRMGATDCIFCKIAAGDIPSTKVYEDDSCVAFNDLTPQAPTHILIIPRGHIDSLDKAESNYKETLGHLLLTAADIARDRGFADNGYRLVINTNPDGGQTVFHLHIHLLAGRLFVFPPG